MSMSQDSQRPKRDAIGRFIIHDGQLRRFETVAETAVEVEVAGASKCNGLDAEIHEGAPAESQEDGDEAKGDEEEELENNDKNEQAAMTINTQVLSPKLELILNKLNSTDKATAKKGFLLLYLYNKDHADFNLDGFIAIAAAHEPLVKVKVLLEKLSACLMCWAYACKNWMQWLFIWFSLQDYIVSNLQKITSFVAGALLMPV